MKKKMGLAILLNLVLVLLSLVITPRDAFAVFSLSAQPYEGGYDLRYGNVAPNSERINRELTVTINTDIARQYRVIQTLLEPLSTAQGGRLPDNSLVVYNLRGTNRFGTMNVEQEVPVRFGRQVIYTSNQTGTADSFTLVYGLIPPAEMAPGSYRGRISFTLEPIVSTQAPVVVILDILAQVQAESSIEIKTASGTRNLLLKADREEAGTADVSFQIKGGLGRQFRIYQVITEQPVSMEGNTLDWQAVTFKGAGAQKGMVVNEPAPLSPRSQVIYTSSPRGEADSFEITYSLGDLSQQKAGTYQAGIKYLFESMGTTTPGMRLLDTLSLEIQNPRIFELNINPEMGGVIQFRDLKPNQPPRVQEVDFQVKSNIGKAYQVTQNMSALLTTKEGRTIAQGNLVLNEESLETKGILKYPDKVEVRAGQMVLFVSDKKGSSDSFKVIYELSVPKDVFSGDYATNFTYSISEI